MMLMASNGHFFTQIPQPEEISRHDMERDSLNKRILFDQVNYAQKSALKPESLKHLPMQSGSEMNASLLLGPTSMQSFPSLTTGQDFLHSWLHFLGLHFDVLTIAIRVKWSSSPPFPDDFPPFFFGGIARTNLQRNDYINCAFQNPHSKICALFCTTTAWIQGPFGVNCGRVVVGSRTSNYFIREASS